MQATFLSQSTRPKRCDDFHSKYQVNERPFGGGSYGLVYDGLDKITGKKVAIKKINHFSRDPVDAKRVLREISLLRMLKGHPNIITLEYLATSVSKDSLDEVDLVFERYDSDLNKIISSTQLLTSRHIQYFLYQILCGMYYIHSAKLVHRDLKPSNILVNTDCVIKVCDFGLARATQVIGKTAHSAASAPPALFRQLTGYVVTRWYRSPEVILGCRGRGEAPSDMWSIGCILAELLLRKPLFPAESSQKVLDLILNLTGTPARHDCGWIENEKGFNYITKYPSKTRQNFQEKFNGSNASALDLLTKLLEFNPTKRITAALALQHPFVRSFFNSHDMLTFPLKPGSPADESSLDDYYQFETELDGHSSKSPAEITQWACALIQKEIARYAPDPVSSSFMTTNSFFQDSGDSANQMRSSLKLFSGAPHFWSDANKHKTLRSNVVPYSFKT